MNPRKILTALALATVALIGLAGPHRRRRDRGPVMRDYAPDPISDWMLMPLTEHEYQVIADILDEMAAARRARAPRPTSSDEETGR